MQRLSAVRVWLAAAWALPARLVCSGVVVLFSGVCAIGGPFSNTVRHLERFPTAESLTQANASASDRTCHCFSIMLARCHSTGSGRRAVWLRVVATMMRPALGFEDEPHVSSHRHVIYPLSDM
jgi:hypothetical protein